MTEPRVAVIVPCFNAARYLTYTLDSIAAQTYPHWECVVVDDGSSDSTADLAAGFAARDARFRVLRGANAGVSTARNRGIAHVSDDVEYLAFLDADDTWTPDALAVLVAEIDADPNAVGVYGLAEYMDGSGRPVRPGAHPAVQADRRRLGRLDLVDAPPEEMTTFSILLVSGPIWPAGVGLHRRVEVARAGGFDADLSRAEDWELFLRMSRSGHFRPVPRHLVWYRRHADNATASERAMAGAVLQVRFKVQRLPGTSPRQRREGRRVWRRLAGRWVLWSLLASVRAARAGDPGGAVSAARAAVCFARRSWQPVRPDERMIDSTLGYVVQRSTGRGGSVNS